MLAAACWLLPLWRLLAVVLWLGCYGCCNAPSPSLLDSCGRFALLLLIDVDPRLAAAAPLNEEMLLLGRRSRPIDSVLCGYACGSIGGRERLEGLVVANTKATTQKEKGGARTFETCSTRLAVNHQDRSIVSLPLQAPAQARVCWRRRPRQLAAVFRGGKGARGFGA